MVGGGCDQPRFPPPARAGAAWRVARAYLVVMVMAILQTPIECKGHIQTVHAEPGGALSAKDSAGGWPARPSVIRLGKRSLLDVGGSTLAQNGGDGIGLDQVESLNAVETGGAGMASTLVQTPSATEDLTQETSEPGWDGMDALPTASPEGDGLKIGTAGEISQLPTPDATDVSWSTPEATDPLATPDATDHPEMEIPTPVSTSPVHMMEETPTATFTPEATELPGGAMEPLEEVGAAEADSLQSLEASVEPIGALTSEAANASGNSSSNASTPAFFIPAGALRVANASNTSNATAASDSDQEADEDDEIFDTVRWALPLVGLLFLGICLAVLAWRRLRPQLGGRAGRQRAYFNDMSGEKDPEAGAEDTLGSLSTKKERGSSEMFRAGPSSTRSDLSASSAISAGLPSPPAGKVRNTVPGSLLRPKPPAAAPPPACSPSKNLRAQYFTRRAHY